LTGFVLYGVVNKIKWPFFFCSY